MENTNNDINEKIIKSLATELAKIQFLELFNILSACKTFEEAYNKLGGCCLDANGSFMKDELIYVGLRFDYNYKNIKGTIFYDTKSQNYEIYNGVYVKVDKIVAPVLYIENIYDLVDFE